MVVTGPTPPGGPPPAGHDVPDVVLGELRQAFVEGEASAPVWPLEIATEDDPTRDDPTEDDPTRDDPTTKPSGPDAAVPPRATIVIGGDTLPDALYLDEAGDLGGGPGSAPADGTDRDTIVIGNELDSTGAFDAVTVPSRSMDPRVRARRIAVKRAKGRRRLIIVGAIVGVVVLVVSVLAVFASSWFSVQHVEVQGAVYTEARYGTELQAVIDDLVGQPVLLVDTMETEARLEEIPWIERAFVHTNFPDRVTIDVRERRPLATFQGSDGRFRVIDRDGQVLDVLDGRPVLYMLIEGVGPDIGVGVPAGGQYAAAAQLVGALPGEIREITVSATVDPTTGDLGLTLQGVVADDAQGETPPEVEVRIGSFSGLDGKLARLLQSIRDGLGSDVRIDVSTAGVSRSG